MLKIEGHHTGGPDIPTVQLDHGCPRCGLCPDCREEVKAEVRRDFGLEKAMAIKAEHRGFLHGIGWTLLIGGLAGIVAWLARTGFRL